MAGSIRLKDIVEEYKVNPDFILNQMLQFYPNIGFYSDLSDEQVGMAKQFCQNHMKIIENVSGKDRLSGPKIIGKIPLPEGNIKQKVFNSEKGSSVLGSTGIGKAPRLLAAAREFNISQDNLVHHLVGLGYNTEDLKPTSRLTPKMYLDLQKAFQSDKVSKAKRDLIDLSKANFDSIGTSKLNLSQEPILPSMSNEEHEEILNDFMEPDPLISIPTFKNNPSNEIHMIDQALTTSPVQRILFGSPGTGKSHRIDGASDSYLNQLGISDRANDLIKTVFHPEYTYGDFMGKLLPYTNDEGQVEYRFYAGHFLQALGRAYKNIVLAKREYDKLIEEDERNFKREIGKTNKKDFTEDDNAEMQRRKSAILKPIPQNVSLVIDEINRGNSAAIFGTIFQLLDREPNGWSSYQIKISDLENSELLKVISFEKREYKKRDKVDEVAYTFDGEKCSESEFDNLVQSVFESMPEENRVSLLDRNIKLPPNLSIIATMNTSDNSIYFMDSAFKRRWEWEFIDITSEDQRLKQEGRKLFDGSNWADFVDNLNAFIKRNGKRIRKIEDKQIGYYFIKDVVISKDAIKNKLLFFLWDSIFSNDKKPLEELIGSGKSLVTFGDFVQESDSFISAIKAISNTVE